MGWSLVNPGLLAACGLVAVPILIHLLNRRRFRIVRWAAMDFLLEATRENKRRIRIEQWLVLLLRCLALLLLALLLTRPALSSAGLGFLPGVDDAVERVVVLDDSGSMAYRSGRSTAFSRAKGVLTRFVADLARERPRDGLVVVLASAPDEPIRLEAPGSEEAQRFVERLGELEPGSASLDLPRALASALGTEPPAGRKTVVYVISDLRRRDWQGEQGDVPKRVAEVLQASGRLQDDRLRLLGVDVGGEGTRNLGIVAIEPVDKLALAGLPYEVRIRVRNYGAADVAQVPLYLETRDASGAAGRVPLPPLALVKAGQEAVATHRTTFLAAGPQALSFQLGGDALPLDDARHLALEVREQLSALVVEGERGEGPLGGSGALLALALAPPGDDLSGVAPRVVAANDVAGEELQGIDSVILCNLSEWPAARQAELERYVAKGGGLAVFLGERVDAQRYADVLYREGQGLLPLALGEEVVVDDPAARPSLAEPEGDHPLTQIFMGERNPFLSRVRARRWRVLAPSERDAQTRVVLRLTDEARTPFLVERGFGRGRVLLFNTSADNSWSSWPRNPSWPVVAQELVRLLAPPAHQGRLLACGEPLELAVDPGRYEPRARVQAPGQREARELFAAPVEGAPLPVLRYRSTGAAGIYRLALKRRQGGEEVALFAANLDPSEGDLTPAQREVFLAGLRQAGLEGLEPSFTLGGDQTELLRVTDGTRAEVWGLLLRLLVVVLLVEQVVAWRAGHHPAPRPAEAA